MVICWRRNVKKLVRHSQCLFAFQFHLTLILQISAVSQNYQTEPINEYVILGNDVLMKCSIPSFVSDFVSVIGWVDNLGNDHHPTATLGNFLREIGFRYIRLVRQHCCRFLTLLHIKWFCHLQLSGSITRHQSQRNMSFWAMTP